MLPVTLGISLDFKNALLNRLDHSPYLTDLVRHGVSNTTLLFTITTLRADANNYNDQGLNDPSLEEVETSDRNSVFQLDLALARGSFRTTIALWDSFLSSKIPPLTSNPFVDHAVCIHGKYF